MAYIELKRSHRGYTDRLRNYKVFIDGEQRGEIGLGGRLSMEVAPGVHEVVLRISWCRSPVVKLEVSDGETVRLRCKPRANPLTGLWFITFGRDRYIKLVRADEEQIHADR